MTLAFSTRPPFRRAIPLLLGFLLAPVAVQAQTFDSTAGTAPSQKLSTPPDAAPINQPGAMRRAYSHSGASAARHKTTAPAGRTPH